MTLVEVMVAGAIAAVLFYYISEVILNMNKAQSNFERGQTVTTIKENVVKLLEDVNAWISNPEKSVPKGNNDINLYYYKYSGSDIGRLSYTEEEVQELELKYKRRGNFICPEEMGNCRVILWSTKNEILTPRKLKLYNKLPPHFKVLIGFETPDGEISRSYLPEFKVKILDTHKDPKIKINKPIFYVNSTGSRREKNSNLVEVDGKLVDINSRKRCFLKYLEDHQDRNKGLLLCKSATSLAPIECYNDFQHRFGLSSDLAIIACVGAKNAIPQKCYKEITKLTSSISKIHLAVLCSAAKSMMPVKCFKKINDHNQNNNDISRFKVCSRAEDTTPAECYIELIKKSPSNIEVVEQLCPQHKG